MKKVLYTCVIALLCLNLNAQTSGGPDLYGYTWKNSNHTVSPPTFSWFDITSIGIPVSGLADDNIVGPFIATGFQFYWYPITQFWIGSNGYISFAGENIASPFPLSVPLSSGANDWIAALLSDLNFSGTANPAQCYYFTDTDTICISFINVPFWTNSTSQQTGSNSLQIILNKTDKSITFNYLATNQGVLTTMDDVVGIENNTGNIGLSSIIDVLPPDSFTVKFYYPTTVTFAVTDGGVDWNNNEKSAGIFIKSQLDTLTLTTNIKNFGNQALGSFSVKDTVYNSSGSPVTTGTYTVPPLTAGNDTLVTFSNTFIAPTVGTYRYNTAVTGITGDMVPSNNRKQQEIIAVNTALTTMTLDYSDGIPDGGGLGWNGGNGGIAVYIAPPFYPAKVTSSRFYISANAIPAVGFHAMIYDDDGLNGAAGTLLDSVYVSPTVISTGVYTTVATASNNIVIDSGGVYVLWLMDANGINIARDITLPISRRTYEVISGGWAEYRDLQTEDFLMGINIQKSAPAADFSSYPGSGQSVLFFDQSLGMPTSWLWKFGNAGDTSTLQNPTYSYPMNGTYNVCLKATNQYGSDSICKAVVVNSYLPLADFVYNATGSPIVAFTDSSSGIPTSWLWDFGDGVGTSTSQNPSYTYLTNGTFNVCLKVTNAAGSDSICKLVVVNTILSIAKFSYDSTNVPTIVFTDSSTASPTSWLWDFDDNGATSIVQNPSYTFKNNGVHNVCLTPTNVAGVGSTYCKNISITGIGISENSISNVISVYPNPFSDKTIIQFNVTRNHSDIKLKCYNMMGEIVETTYEVNSNRIVLSKGSLSDGTYFFELYNNETKLGNGKFLIQ